MKREHAQEYTDALGQVLAGAVRLADVALELGVHRALGLTEDEWAQRRLAGQVRLSIPEREKVVPELLEQGMTQREVADALGVSVGTVNADKQRSELNTDGADDAEPRSELNGRDRSAMFTSDSDDWSTPRDLFDALDHDFGPLELDVCATADNAKCPRFFTRDDDGLAQTWTGRCWMNPPYGDAIARWVEKAWKSSKQGATVVCLVPARVDTNWWWDYCLDGEIRFLRGRLRFGDGTGGAPFPSAVVTFGRPPAVLWWVR